jgi:LPXTG-motif cell wall-anchored protein
MAFKRILSAATAVALVFSPTVAVAARSASPSSAGAQQVAPAAETVDEASELRRHGILIPLAGVVLIILIILLVTKKKKNKAPVSP